jgi:hypothetical protein
VVSRVLKKLEYEGKINQIGTEIKIIWVVTLVTDFAVWLILYLFWF